MIDYILDYKKILLASAFGERPWTKQRPQVFILSSILKWKKYMNGPANRRMRRM